MPFGLKNAQSQFQKTMVTLFQPLLANALIYVDDILLFSKDADSHEKLLAEFYNLVKSQGIMLLEKKIGHWANINRVFGNDYLRWKVYSIATYCYISQRVSRQAF